MDFYKPGQGQNSPLPGPPAVAGISVPLPAVGRKTLITPNPKLKLLDQVREVSSADAASPRVVQNQTEQRPSFRFM